MVTGPIRYCALTTISLSMRSFMLPAALHLSRNGYDVTVGCIRDEDFAKNIPIGLKYLPLSIKRGFSLKGTLVGIWQLFIFFKKNKIQMVEYGTENVSFCASIAAWLAGVPVRIYNHWGARYVGYPAGILRTFSMLIERTCARFSTVVRQSSKLNMEQCISDHIYPAEKVKVLGYGGTVGADFNRFSLARKAEYNTAFRVKYGIPTDDFVFGDICWVRKDKGSNELIYAFKKINDPNCWLVFIGDIFDKDPVSTELMEWAQSCDHVIFTGRVMDVEHYVAGIDCFIHPSYREGLGMVLQEAAAMAIPIITTDIPGPSEFCENGKYCLLARKADAEDLYSKMKLLYEDRTLLAKYGKEVYNMTKERYERQEMVSRILNDREELKAKYLNK